MSEFRTGGRTAPSRTKMLTVTGLMTAVICIVGPVSIPIPVSPVPVTLTNFAVCIAVYVLGLKAGTVSCLIYLCLGAAGLPVFSAFSGGIGKLAGPTGGYLVGYIPSALFGALVMKLLGKNILIASFFSAVVSTVFFYVVGLPWLSLMLDLPLSGTLGAGLFPFIFGDVLKIIVATLVTPSVRSRVKELLECEE